MVLTGTVRLLNNNIALQNIKIVLFCEPSKTVMVAITGLHIYLGVGEERLQVDFLPDTTDCERFIE